MSNPKFDDPYRNAWWDHCTEQFKQHFNSLNEEDQEYFVPTADGYLPPNEVEERYAKREENNWEDEVGCDPNCLF